MKWLSYIQINNWWLISLLLTFYTLQSTAQTSGEKYPLKAVLDSIEMKYEVVFSYADEYVQGVLVNIPNRDFSLDQWLGYLEDETDLIFNTLDARFIAILKEDAPNLLACCFVRDEETNEPIEAVFVRDKNTESITISDGNGFFELLPADDHELVLSHLAYHTKIIHLTPSDTCLTVTLKPKVAELENVLISNYLVRGISRKAGGILEMKIQKLPVLAGLSEPDVLYTMQVLPGIQSPNESVSNINIRGGTNDQNLILWNGIKMYQSGHFFGLISAFNPYFIDNVSLTKNGTSAQFGDGVSGTLQINPQDEVITKYSGGAGLNLLAADTYGNIPLSKKASLSFSARRSITDLFRTPTYKNYFERSFKNTEVISPDSADFQRDDKFFFYDLNAKLDIQPGKNDHLSLSVIHVFNDLKYEENEILQGIPESKTSSLQQKNTGIGGNYERNLGKRMKIGLQSYLSSYKLRAVNFDIANDQRLIQENSIVEVSNKLNFRQIISTKFDIHSGFQFTETGIVSLEDINNPDFRRVVKEVMRTTAFFTEGYYQPFKFSEIRGGLRGSYYSRLKKFVLEPRISLRQQINKRFSLEVLGEFKSQASTQIIDLQNDFLGVEKRRWVLSNGEDIPMIQSQQLSIGGHYNKSKFLITLDAYLKKVKGIITSSQAFQNQFELIRSAGNYRVHGIDFLANLRSDNLSTWLSYTMAANVYRFPDLSRTSFPNNLDITHFVTTGVSLAYQKFQFSSSFNWNSGRPYTPVNKEVPMTGSSINYSSPNSTRLKDYLRVDFSAKYIINLSEKIKAESGLSVWNVSSNENILNTYYQITNPRSVTLINDTGLPYTINVVFRIVIL